MIPREILKKIRQIELRTNRIVTATLAGFSFQPSPQFRRIPRAVKNRNHGENIILDCEVDAVCPEAFQADFAGAATHFAKEFRLKQRPIHRTKNFAGKFLTQARRFIFILVDGLEEFGLGFGLEKGIQIHHHPKRSRISALTCSKGIPRRGFFSNSARRRSSSAVCSGVSSSSKPPYFSKTFSATLCCCCGGNCSICSRISVAFMAAIYAFDSLAQARFFRREASRSSISAKTCSAGIPRPGFFRASSARRSSSAICSGVSSSSNSVNSSKICWTVSRRSFSGIRRSSSRIPVALMAAIYSFDLFVQAEFFRRADSSFVIQHSTFSPA